MTFAGPLLTTKDAPIDAFPGALPVTCVVGPTPEEKVATIVSLEIQAAFAFGETPSVLVTIALRLALWPTESRTLSGGNPNA